MSRIAADTLILPDQPGFAPNDLRLSGAAGLHVVVGENNAGKTRLLRRLLSTTLQAKVSIWPYVRRGDTRAWEDIRFEKERKTERHATVRWARDFGPSDRSALPAALNKGRMAVVDFPFPPEHAMKNAFTARVAQELQPRPIEFVPTQRYFSNIAKPDKSLVNVTPTVPTLVPWLDARQGYKEPAARHTLEEITTAFRALTDLEVKVFNDDKGDLAAHVKDPNGVDRSLDDCGDGLRDLLYLVTEVFARPDHDLLMDEPGLRLHPKLQRRLMRFLESRAIDRAFWLATHDGAMVGDSAVRSHTLVRRNADTTVVEPLPAPKERRRAFLQLGWQPGDALLSDTLLLCEGPSDKLAFEFAIERIGKSGIVVADLGGSGVVWEAKHEALLRRVSMAAVAAPFMKVVALLDRDNRPVAEWDRLTSALRRKGLTVVPLSFRDLEAVWVEAGLVEAVVRGLAHEASARRLETIAPPDAAEVTSLIAKHESLLNGCALLDKIAQELTLRFDKEVAAEAALAALDPKNGTWKTLEAELLAALEKAQPWLV